jgi:hypothetical protein
MKKGDVVAVADDDDEVRTRASENHVTATLCTEEFFLGTHISSEVGGGGAGYRLSKWHI